ncbi:MAG: hypothetical protein ACHQ4H_05580 [Ktedonobacterales bacterium]
MRLSETVRVAQRDTRRTARTAAMQPYDSSYPRKPGRGREPGRGKARLVRVVASLASTTLLLAVAGFAAFGLGQRFQTHAAAINQDCVLVVPDQPLTAQGLATPYQLRARERNAGACREANPKQSAFVQAAVLDPTTGKISVYAPLVVNNDAGPAVAPALPALPHAAVVALWFGFNGQALHLVGAHGGTLAAANCVNGLGRSIFGQVSYCNAVAFFQAANTAIQAGMLIPPPLGKGSDGLTCPTVRDFSIVDQDQSDNVTSTYLVTGDGMIAQNTAANRAKLQGKHVRVAKNGSDNLLLSVAVDGALGCTPWEAPDLADNGALMPALPLDELQAAADQQAPVASVPHADPMTVVNGTPNLAKQNLYRQGVDQAPVASAAQARADQLSYCRNLYQIGPKRLLLDKPFTSVQPSLDPAAANNLYTFLAQRFVFTFGSQGLGCASLLHVTDPVAVRTNARGVAVAATIHYPGGNDSGRGSVHALAPAAARA